MFEFLLTTLLFPQLQQYKLAALDFFTFNIAQEKIVNAPQRKYSDILDVFVAAQSAIAVDAKTGAIVYEKNSDEVRSMASITKLMTAIVFLENDPQMSALVTMKEIDRSPGGIEHFFIGEQIRVSDVLYAALIGSDNDAAHILARVSGYGLEEFVTKMNEKAAELGMSNTIFKDPTGLHTGNVSTAQDIVLLLEEASTHELLVDASTRKSHTFDVVGLDEEPRTVRVYTTDQLTSSNYLTLTAAKTGYLPEAGYCLATFLHGSNNREYYIVVLGSDTIQNRFQDVKAIEYFISNAYSYDN